MKKKITIILMLTLLSSCNNANDNSSFVSQISSCDSIKVEDVLESMSNNYSVNYTTSNGSFNVYRTENYFYDEELKGGQFVLYDETMYVYTIHNNILVPRVPFSGYKEDFNKQYPLFEVDMNKFTMEDDVYYTTDTKT